MGSAAVLSMATDPDEVYILNVHIVLRIKIKVHISTVCILLVHELYQITKGGQSTLTPQTAFNRYIYIFLE